MGWSTGSSLGWLYQRVCWCLLGALGVAGVWPSNSAARDRGPKRTVPIDMVVIHTTGGPLCDPATGRVLWIKGGALQDNLRTINAHPVLGIHYMIDRDGRVHPSVPEAEVAHHVKTHSQRSVAIELINDGDGQDPFPSAQIAATVVLLRDLAARHPLRRHGVVRHSDVDRSTMPCDASRRRKVDPGPLYPHGHVLDAVFGPPP
jgi:N-acetylmuramoyl-L-alanine amidase